VDLTLEQFVHAHAGLTRDEFLARVRDPHLLLLRGPTRPTCGRSPAEFTTLRLLPPGRERERELRALIPVRKRPDSNPFAMMITLGRAANNDAVLSHPDVSKLHCYFHRFQGSWTVCDPGSTNGTTVDGVRVGPHGTPLRSGARVRLAGAYDLVFLEPGDLQRVAAGEVIPPLASSA
jgi:hypothetical protein